MELPPLDLRAARLSPRLALAGAALAALLAGCGSSTCGDAHCSEFKNFGGPANKTVFSCISTSDAKVTSYTLKDNGQTLVDCQDRDQESACRFEYYAARENACK